MTEETSTPETAQDDTTAEGSTDTAKEASEEVKPEGSETSEEGDKETEESESTDEEKSEEEEKPGTPESYEKFELPEGVEMTDEQFAEVSEFSQSLNLTQEQAQQAVNYHNEVVGRVVGEVQAQAEQERVDTQTQWENEVKVYNEIGGADMR